MQWPTTAGRVRGLRFPNRSAAFQRHNKKWWLLPIPIILLLSAALLLAASAGVAAFLYPFF